MNLRKAIGKIICALKGKHDDRKRRIGAQWFKICRKCGRATGATEPKRRKKTVAV